jgi:hypothetical protein
MIEQLFICAKAALLVPSAQTIRPCAVDRCGSPSARACLTVSGSQRQQQTRLIVSTAKSARKSVIASVYGRRMLRKETS